MTIEEQRLEVEHFISNLESVQYFNRKLIAINLELVSIATKLYEASGIKYDTISSQRDPYRNNILHLMMKEEELINQEKKYRYKITKLSYILDMCNPEVKRALVFKYVLKNSWNKTADMLGYTRQGIQKNTKNQLENLFKDLTDFFE